MKYLKYICLSIILMMTACIGNPGEEIDDNDPEPTIPDGFVLLPSANFFKADGNTMITFKVYSDKKDITEDARIYQDLSSGAVRMENNRSGYLYFLCYL